MELERCPNDGTVLSVPIDVVLQSRYEFIEPIGKGGMSVVYKARHRLIGNLVAIKLLQDKLSDNPNHVKRFQVEAKAAAVLDHQSLIKVNDFGILPTGFTFLVMDYADGSSLSDVVKQAGMLPAARALPLFMQICEGLSHAHSKGVLHRDLKPSNVIVVNDPQVGERIKIVDFGIAKVQAGEDGIDPKLTATGEVFGSPYYMSPEQCTGGLVDARSDIYAMGCLMYETLSGKLPLSGSNIFETIHKQISEPPEPLAKLVSDGQAKALSPIIDKALRKDPAERYQSFDEMLNDLRAIAEGKNVKVKTKLPLDKWLGMGIAGGLLVLGLAAGACYLERVGPFAPPAVQINPDTSSKADSEEAFPSDDYEDKDHNGPIPTDQSFNRYMTDSDEVEQWHQFGVDHAINLVYRNVGKDQIERMAADTKAVKLNLQGNATIDDTALLPLKDHPSIETLRLSGAAITGKSLDTFATIPKLKHLLLGNNKINPDDFGKFANLANVEELWLLDSNLDDAALEKLPQLPRVKKLRLDDNPKLSDASMEIVARKFPNLHILALRRNNLTDAGLSTLLKAPALTHLRIIDTRININTINAIKKTRKLSANWDECLEAGTRPFDRRTKILAGASQQEPAANGKQINSGGQDLTDAKLLAIGADYPVQTIFIPDSPKITYAGLLGLQNRRVWKLSLAGCKQLDDRAMRLMPTMQSLLYLDISNTNFSPQSLQELEYCGNFHELAIRKKNMTYNDLQYMPRQLYRLNIGDNAWFDNKCVAYLRQHCPSLTWWNMPHTGITDGAIDELEKVPELERVIVSKSCFTPAGLKRLEQLRTRNVTVEINP